MTSRNQIPTPSLENLTEDIESGFKDVDASAPNGKFDQETIERLRFRLRAIEEAQLKAEFRSRNTYVG